MRKRTRAREAALQALYQLDIRQEDEAAWVQEFLAARCDDSEIRKFAQELVKGTREHLRQLDEQIASVAAHWKLDRMAPVDRNILRMAIFEMMFLGDVPPKVSINEAVDLAKRYGSAQSGAFVNGVLDAVHLRLSRAEDRECKRKR